jgi:hypothetical protein
MSVKAGLFYVLVFCGVLLTETLAEPSVEGQEGDLLAHWVVSVPQGLERARRLSEDHGLNFLGEVLPDSNLFHVSGKEHHCAKRSTAEGVHQSLASHPGAVIGRSLRLGTDFMNYQIFLQKMAKKWRKNGVFDSNIKQKFDHNISF